MSIPVFIKAGYAWRQGMRHTSALDANEVGNEIAALSDQSFSAIVARAQADDSAMHPYFEWNDAIAGEQWRVDQARELTRAIVIVVADVATETEHTTDQRAFIALYHGTNEQAGRFAPNEATAIPINIAPPATEDTTAVRATREVFAPLIRLIASAPHSDQDQATLDKLRRWADAFRGNPLFAGVVAAIAAIG